jgi:hypothetical protein
MKKLICILFLFPFLAKAQNASFVNITDSATGVHYDSLYVVVTDVTVSSPVPVVSYTVNDSTIVAGSCEAGIVENSASSASQEKVKQ